MWDLFRFLLRKADKQLFQQKGGNDARENSDIHLRLREISSH